MLNQSSPRKLLTTPSIFLPPSCGNVERGGRSSSYQRVGKQEAKLLRDLKAVQSQGQGWLLGVISGLHGWMCPWPCWPRVLSQQQYLVLGVGPGCPMARGSEQTRLKVADKAFIVLEETLNSGPCGHPPLGKPLWDLSVGL